MNKLDEKLCNKMELTTGDKDIIYFLDNLLMIYTYETTFAWDPFNKINLNKFF